MHFRGTRLLLTLVTLACAPVFAQKGGPLASEKVLWLGDSITQAGDYVTFAEYYLNRQFASGHFDFVSVGLSSETVSCLTEKDHPFPRPCLSERLQRALDLVHPHVIVACYGMNDGIYHPQSPERMAAFQKGIQNLIAAARAKDARVILIAPPPFDPVAIATTLPASAPDFSYKAPYQKYDDVLTDYAAWEKTLAAADVQVVDIHTPINAYLAKQRVTDPKFSFTKDGIHPDLAGHLLMTRILLKDLGVKVPQIALDDEVAHIQSDPLYVIVKDHRQKRSQAWLDYIGYTRDKTVKTENYQKQLNAWKLASEAAKAGGATVPAQPATPNMRPDGPFLPAGLYNAMIAPFTPFPIKGAIWYQGETNANANPNGASLYARAFQGMIRDWRRAWGEGDFPFLFVQLANYKANPAWPDLREAQRQTLSLANTGMAVTIDIGNPDNIHPTDKQDVGLRLSLAARVIAYGEKIEDSGPTLHKAVREGEGLRVWFDHTTGGLVAKGGAVKGFEVAGADRKFVVADAHIEGSSIVAWNAGVTAPVYVRYAYADNPDCNLFNGEGLPASPFRSWE